MHAAPRQLCVDAKTLSRSICALVALVATFALGPLATAQAAQPYKLIVRDVTAKPADSKKIAPVLIEALGQQRELSLILDDEADEALKTSKMTNKDWRSGAAIKKKSKSIAKAMASAGADAVAIIEVQKKGKIMAVTILDAQANELKTFRGNVTKATLKEEQANKASQAIVQLLKDNIKPKASAEVAILEEPETTTSTSTATTTGSDDGQDDLKATLDRPKAQGGLLSDAILAQAGLTIGRRGLTSTSQTVELTHVAPFIGPTALLELNKALLDGDAQLGLELGFTWAPFNTELTDTQGNPTSVSSRVFRTGFNARFHYALASAFAAGLYGGLDYLAITIDPNEFYTGHRYISARVGLSTLIQPTDGVTMRVEGGVMPYVNGLYQAPDNTPAKPAPLGLEAGASVALRLTDSIQASVLYQMTYFGPSDVDPAQATDLIHQGGLMAGFAF